ncbi:exodeoxyribonuclease VII large subunit [Candidatus Tokpelaia sp.]|uniref:exodeoxyribonuclease VII large subunit n=1 Tax=Candidatus Tokpelaia sp. TaxID=2233777 RepID=UPI001280004F|nr:exodeoxyribonuclease VII large subunit [Candidatus Tokpelaia sp.]KAA6405167.1 exodeoxyribonuclease VII large subunit [Candidatus Tokpelaia sp.]
MRKMQPQSNATEFTVSEISGALRQTIEETYGNVRVRGEISGYRGPHSSGHAYFALKDDKARLEAVIWRTAVQNLKFKPEEGLEVIAAGHLSSYAGSSKYQLIIEQLEPAGEGALMALLAARRQKLAQEGLFDTERKKPLPFMPRVIGVITSPTGAVIRDIIHRIKDRFPLHILVWPVRVQGETTGAEVVAAIRGFNALPEYLSPLLPANPGTAPLLPPPPGIFADAAPEPEPASPGSLLVAPGAHPATRGSPGADSSLRPPPQSIASNPGAIPRPDLLIIARGGGSLEDLWGFNDEDLVRAAAQSSLPIISAIGHETDWTLLDYAADRRAPTPTGAAEMAVPVKAGLAADLAALQARLGRANRRLLQQNQQNLRALSRAFPGLDRLLSEPRRKLDDISRRLGRALLQAVQYKRSIFAGAARQVSFYLITRPLAEKRHLCQNLAARLLHNFRQYRAIQRQKLAMPARLLHSLSYENILERGFALVFDQKGALVRRVQAVIPGQELGLRFADGTATVAAITTKPGVQTAEKLPAEIKPRQEKKPGKSRSTPVSEQGDLF